jgi:hypothetical protein
VSPIKNWLKAVSTIITLSPTRAHTNILYCISLS